MHKVLIANRGEIAVRIIRACHDLGLQTVAIYSTADRESLHVLHADEAICIGSPPSTESYLKIPNIISACEITGADAVHPGYGFLSENAQFASICESCGLNFIGPSHRSIALLGDKAKAKETASKAGCPIIPGSAGEVESLEEAIEIAEEMGYPVFVKAVAGGGGKGIRVVDNSQELTTQFPSAVAEAEKSFGNGGVYIEKMVKNPRHVEIQVVGDKYGNYLHLAERDCSIQRRRQKLIEETPSPALNPKLRKKMGEAAVAIVKKAKYFSLATVEFLLDDEGNFFFLEVNTRIQVEHTITEELTGIDLAELQLRIARGEKLPFKQKDIQFQGHVFQFRINAENPSTGFTPSPGKLEYFVPPGGPKVRVDTHCYSGYTIPPYYDSMIAKLIVKGENRKDALAVAKRALKEFHMGGIHSTLSLHLYLISDKPFVNGDFNLSYLDSLLDQQPEF